MTYLGYQPYFVDITVGEGEIKKLKPITLFAANNNAIEEIIAVGQIQRGEMAAANNQKNAMQKQFLKQVQLQEILLDTIYLNLGSLTSKKIPLTPDIDINYHIGYDILEPIKIEPDSIIITGPETQIEKIKSIKLEAAEKKLVKNFFIITAFYELTQIIINNSDILLVKHYFNAVDAGLYASLALIGRVVYFIAWMFVMLLLPTVIQLKKDGKPTVPILLKYVGYIAVIATVIILACFFFPNQIIFLLFGNDYISIAPLLWKYALATGIFAVSNIFAYYYLSLDKYVPVVLSGLFGMLQVFCIVFYHDSLMEVVHVQIAAMVLLLIMQLTFFFLSSLKERKSTNI